MNPLLTIASSTIVLMGNSSGVWSPSHPDLYPPPVQTTLPIPGVAAPLPVGTFEQPYIPETPLTDENGVEIIRKNSDVADVLYPIPCDEWHPPLVYPVRCQVLDMLEEGADINPTPPSQFIAAPSAYD